MNDKLKTIRKSFDHGAAKQTLKEKYEAKMLFAAFGGMWKAGPELLATLHMFNPEIEPKPVLLDEYENPCQVDPGELFTMASQRWQEQMNAWHKEFTEMQKKR